MSLLKVKKKNVEPLPKPNALAATLEQLIQEEGESLERFNKLNSGLAALATNLEKTIQIGEVLHSIPALITTLTATINKESASIVTVTTLITNLEKTIGNLVTVITPNSSNKDIVDDLIQINNTLLTLNNTFKAQKTDTNQTAILEKILQLVSIKKEIVKSDPILVQMQQALTSINLLLQQQNRPTPKTDWEFDIVRDNNGISKILAKAKTK